MIAYISDERWINLDQVTQGAEEVLVKNFSVRHPRSFYIDTRSGWDGWYRKYSVSKQRLALPFLQDLKKLCQDNDIPLEIVDKRKAPDFPAPRKQDITDSFLAGVTLHPYQIEALHAACDHNIGLFDMTTGSGKCMTGETKITMNGLDIKISDLFVNVGDEEVIDVSGFNLNVLGPNGYERISSLYKTNVREIYKVELEDGKFLRGVSDHRIFTDKEFVKLINLRIGDNVQVYPKESIELIDRRKDRISRRDKIWKKEGSEAQEAVYKIFLQFLPRTDDQYDQEFHNQSGEIWKTFMQKMYLVIGSQKRIVKSPREICDSVEEIQREESNITSDEKPCDSAESNGNMREKIWAPSTSDYSEIRQKSCRKKGNEDKETERNIAVIQESHREIQADYGPEEPTGNREHKEKKIRNLEKESCDGGFDKRIIFESAQDQNTIIDYEIWKDQLPEQIRIAIHKAVRRIEDYIQFKERTDDKICKFMVSIGFPFGEDRWLENDNRSEISISIRTEKGINIGEEIGSRTICNENWDDVPSIDLQKACRNGFLNGKSWSKVKSIHKDGLENCYDIQIEDDSHCYYTNDILSHNTEVMCGIIKMFRCPTLVVTEQIVVLEQIIDRLKIRNVVHNDDIGKFCYGERPDGNLVMVGSIQSLSSPSPPSKTAKLCTTKQAVSEGIRLAKAQKIPDLFPDMLIHALHENPSGVRKLKGKYLSALRNHVSNLMHQKSLHWNKVRRKNAVGLQEMAKKCHLLLVDECDRSSAANYNQLFQRIFTGRRKYGFSGTPFDPEKPVEELLLKERLGGVISRANRKQLMEIGQIIPIRYFMIKVGDQANKSDSTALDIAEREQIIENEEFHSLINKIVSGFSNEATMILLDTLSIVDLGHVLEEIIPNSAFIYGQTSKPRRREVIDLFEKREIKCLIGGKILKRGLDLKGGVDNLIIIGGGKLISNLDQMIGRAVRKNERGYSRVFDFLFLNNKYLYAHSRARLKAIASLGYLTKVVIDGKQIDGEKFIKSRFRIPKKKGESKTTSRNNPARRRHPSR